MKIALYVRVSTDEQAREGFSISEQQTRLQAYCIAQGWDHYELFIDDGYSAKDIDRPKLNEIIDMVKQKQISKVMVTKLDRMSRRLLDLLNLIDFFQDHSVSFVSVSEAFDTNTPAGRLTLQVLGAVAEFERERIAERVRDNMYHIAKEGKPVNKPCYGFDLVDIETGKIASKKDGIGGNCEIRINEQEAIWAIKGAEMIISDQGPWIVAKMFNESGILTKRGNMWTAKAVRIYYENNEMLRGNSWWNRTYKKGKKTIERPQDEWLLVENTHEGILDNETYEKLQDKLLKTKGVPVQTQKSIYLLSGIVYCGHCGEKMYGMSAKPRIIANKQYTIIPKYHCSGYVKKGQCFSHFIHVEKLEAAVINELLNLDKTDFVGDLKVELSNRQQIESELKHVEKNLSLIDERFQKQFRAYELGIVSIDLLKQAKDRLNKEQKELEQRRSQLIETLANNLSPEEIKKRIQDKVTYYSSTLCSDSLEAKQSAIRDMVQSVTIYEGQKIDITPPY
ncbi:hypothetical protein BHU72_11775 [Desulfuribacillus stibiiarsenatis]|uniref:Resolvase n=1 Tax=Desulfuribacillus stibiiarsenatis TaxID=1390249 RepID=A0A1E5L893_9FIRM|nr:recombinase family protein [Desulfuribacillus stibiiarsenatis]OEH86209.1 hypothetical protein BHU72_11775 [Desulfuribacillus stibiiarsenatis]